jgi:hypothetical protein
MKVFKVWPSVDLNPCIEKDPSACMVWLEESEPGDVIKIEVLEMTEAEYDALPEYTGP